MPTFALLTLIASSSVLSPSALQTQLEPPSFFLGDDSAASGGLALDPGSHAATLSLLPEGVALQVAAASEAEEEARYQAAVAYRRDVGTVHRALGIATWASMTLTVILGFIQYFNLYGLGAGVDDTPCSTGDAVFGQDQCWGTPWPHLASAAVTSALYTATMSLSFGLLFTDPNDVLNGRGEYSDRIRVHAVLALVHLAGMLAQTVVGIGLANGWFGDRSNDYESMQTVAVAHQVIGWTTWAALGAAGAIMIF